MMKSSTAFVFLALIIVAVQSFVLSTPPSSRPLIWNTFSRAKLGTSGRTRRCSSQLFMSLKPAALPLMDSGKALARSGELLVDLTTALDIYGGALSAAGAQIRNSGDCVAQAAASCRFKTGAELVCDELREAATCLAEATGKLKLAVDEAREDKDEQLAKQVEQTVSYMDTCSTTLEAAGAAIMQRQPVSSIGDQLVACGKSLESVCTLIQQLAPEREEAQVSGQRMAYAAERMILAGQELQQGVVPNKPTGGKSWLKG